MRYESSLVFYLYQVIFRRHFLSTRALGDLNQLVLAIAGSLHSGALNFPINFANFQISTGQVSLTELSVRRFTVIISPRNFGSLTNPSYLIIDLHEFIIYANDYATYVCLLGGKRPIANSSSVGFNNANDIAYCRGRNSKTGTHTAYAAVRRRHVGISAWKLYGTASVMRITTHWTDSGVDVQFETNSTP